MSTAAAAAPLIDALAAIVGEARCLSRPEELLVYECDGLTSHTAEPTAVVFPESRGEVQEVIDTCDFFLGEGRRLYGMTVPSEMPDKQMFTFRVPVGTAASRLHRALRILRSKLDDDRQSRGEVAG